MAEQTIYEKGDSLEALATKARQWFITNNVAVPSGAALWQKCSVRRGEIPPGTGVTSLRRYGFNATTFISTITQNPDKKAHSYNPITDKKIEDLGFKLISSRSVLGHKKLTVQCLQCSLIEELDYGTLQRMRKAESIYCRICRKAGGKEKPIEIYDKFDGYKPVDRTEDKRIIYKCEKCSSLIERTHAHISSSEYLVCEKCFPKLNFGARHYTELGYFDSKLEYEAYKILLKYLDKSLVIRQKKYDELFQTGTKHTADFYIPKLNLVLEVTSKYNKIGDKYKQVAEWKKSLSKTVIFAYSLSEVEDIVRPLVKTIGTTVKNC